MASPTGIAPFDPTSYVDKIREKIKSSLVDIIPDAQWDAMLRLEVTRFFENKIDTTPQNSYYGQAKPREVPGEFRQVVLAELEKETVRRVKELLASEEWRVYWDGTKLNVGAKIAELARDNGAAILSKWLEAAIGQVISGIQFARTGQ